MTKHECPSRLLSNSSARPRIATARTGRNGVVEARNLVDELVQTWAALNDALMDARRAEPAAPRPDCKGPAGGATPRYLARGQTADRLAARVAALLETRAITCSGIAAKACCIAVETRDGTVTLDCAADPQLGLSLAHDLIETTKARGT